MSLESENRYRHWVTQGASPVMIAQHAHAQGVHLIEIMGLLRSLFSLNVMEAKEYAIQGVYGLSLNEYQEQYIVPLLADPENGEPNALSDPGTSPHSSSVEAKVAAELALFLEQTPVGSAFELAPSSDLASLLELYITHVLAQQYPEWETESLDAIFATRSQKINEETAEISGMSILMTDQTVTPFFIRLTLASSRDRMASYRVLLGEAGGGALGISGPPCNSLQAQQLLEGMDTRLHAIRWSYLIGGI